jgi:ABC-2 type transport system permease protein
MIGASSIVSHGDILRKVSIPRYLIVIASSFSALINLGLSMVVVFVFAFLNGLTPELSWLLLPFIIMELFILGLGVAFILATAYVRFRDVTYIWEVVLQAGFYASAIIFPMSIVPEKWHEWFFLNPIVQIVQDARAALIPSGDHITIWNTISNHFIQAAPFILIAVIAAIGYKYFKSQSKYFAEDI